MGSRFAAIRVKSDKDRPLTLDEVKKSNCYYLVYEGPIQVAEGSILAIREKLSLAQLKKPIMDFRRNFNWPRVVTVRL